MEIEIGATGNLVRGSVFDWPLAKITKEVRKIEPRLYFKWNPKKNNGYGIWELRIHPTKKTAVYKGELDGRAVWSLEYVEEPLTHHIKDFEVINFSVVHWLREHDTYDVKNYGKHLEDKYFENLDRVDAKNDENRKYVARHYRQEFKQLQEMTQSGYDPLGWTYHNPKNK